MIDMSVRDCLVFVPGLFVVFIGIMCLVLIKGGKSTSSRGAVVVTSHYNRGSTLRAALRVKQSGLRGTC